MIRSIAVLLTLSLFFMPAVFAAGPPESMTPEHLAGTFEKLGKMKADATDEIGRLDRAIEQNNRTIAKSEDIIRQAQPRGKGRCGADRPPGPKQDPGGEEEERGHPGRGRVEEEARR